MDGLRSSLNPMFKREGEEVNGWIKKLSETHVQKRRRGDKWMDSEALPSHVQETWKGCVLGSEEEWQWRLLLSGYKTRRQLIETL
jgi:hypothetical protein